jgi:hypothetical protein
MEFTYENLIENLKIRTEFLRIYDDMIGNLKRSGYIESAAKHAKNRKRIFEEVSIFD